jgi:membrane-associated phospholipid phosphatase
MLVIALVNMLYRASFHLAMVTSMLTALWFFFGAVSLISFVLIPILGFSRYQLGEHTPAQIATGFFIGLIVSLAVFSGFGLGV